MKRVSLLAAALLCAISVATIYAAGAGESSTGDIDEPIELSWVATVQPVDNDGDIVRFVEERFNVDLDMWNTAEGAALNVRLASGEVPDVFAYNMPSFAQYQSDGLLAAIPEDMFQEYAPNLYNVYETDFPEFMEIFFVDGKRYALHTYTVTLAGIRRIVVYRGDWMANVGVERTPDTLEEFEDLMYKFAEDDPDGDGRRNTYGLSESMTEAVYGAFGYLPNLWSERNGEFVFGGIQPEMRDALALLRQWYEDEVLSPEFVTGENKGGQASVSTDFVVGLIGVSSHARYNEWLPPVVQAGGDGATTNELARISPEAVDQLVYGRPPEGPGGRGIYQWGPLRGTTHSFGVQLEDDPEKLAVALQIWDYANGTVEGHRRTRWGELGVHYTYDTESEAAQRWGGETGIAVSAPDYVTFGDISRIGGGITFSSMWAPSIAGLEVTKRQWAEEVEPSLFEDGISNALEYVFLPSAPQYTAELDKIREEAYIGIITGDRPLSHFDEFVENWLDAGGQVLIDEANER